MFVFDLVLQTSYILYKFTIAILTKIWFWVIPLGADKMHDALEGVFPVFSNDKNKNYDTIRSAWEFARNQEQPEFGSSIRLGVILF